MPARVDHPRRRGQNQPREVSGELETMVPIEQKLVDLNLVPMPTSISACGDGNPGAFAVPVSIHGDGKHAGTGELNPLAVAPDEAPAMISLDGWVVPVRRANPVSSDHFQIVDIFGGKRHWLLQVKLSWNQPTRSNAPTLETFRCRISSTTLQYRLMTRSPCKPVDRRGGGQDHLGGDLGGRRVMGPMTARS